MCAPSKSMCLKSVFWGLKKKRNKRQEGSLDQGAGWQMIENVLAENIHMCSLLVLIQQALLESRGIMPATVALSAG